jgi:purine-binding chemotaxis protein CheW
MNIGTLVDEVLEVLEVDKKEIKPSPTIEAKYNLDFIEGVFRKDEEFIMLLNLSEIFSLGEVSFMQDANQLVTEKKEQKA